MERRTVFIVALFLVVAISHLVWENREHAEDGTHGAVAASVEAPVYKHATDTVIGEVFADAGVSDEVTNWGVQTLVPLTRRLLHGYPVESVRVPLHDFLHPVEGESPTLRLGFAPESSFNPEAHMLAAAYYSEEGVPVMELYPTALYHHWLDMKDADGAFSDFLMMVMLHEQYHLVDQGLDLRFDMEGKTLDEIAAVENEAYRYTVRHAKVMQDEGRVPMEALTPLYPALIASVIAGDDLSHSIWVEHGRYVTGRDNTFNVQARAWIEANYQE